VAIFTKFYGHKVCSRVMGFIRFSPVRGRVFIIKNAMAKIGQYKVKGVDWKKCYLFTAVGLYGYRASNRGFFKHFAIFAKQICPREKF